MKYKKQIFGMLLLSVAMVLLLAGCGTLLGSAEQGEVSNTKTQSNNSGNDVENNTIDDKNNADEEVSPTPSVTKPNISNTPELDKNEEDIELVEMIITDNWTNVFIGKIGTQNVCVAIYREGGLLTASYVTQNHEENEIKLKGTIQTNTASFVLNSEDGKTTFKGNIKPDTKEGSLLEGIYTSSKLEVNTKFSLTLDHGIANTYETHYSLSGTNTKDIEEFASKIKLYITEKDKTALAEMIDYPIKVTINGSKVSISDKEEFIKNYDKIINDEFVEKIKNCYTKYLFSNYSGTMIGNGKIWFRYLSDIGLRIFAINN